MLAEKISSLLTAHLCLNDVPGEDSEGVVAEISLLHHLSGQPANKHTQINLLHKQETSVSVLVGGDGGGNGDDDDDDGGGGGCYLDIDRHPQCSLASDERDEEDDEGDEEGGVGDQGAAAGEEWESEGEEARHQDGQAEAGEAGVGREVLHHHQPQAGQGDEDPRDEDQQVDGADGGPQYFVTTIPAHPD